MRRQVLWACIIRYPHARNEHEGGCLKVYGGDRSPLFVKRLMFRFLEFQTALQWNPHAFVVRRGIVCRVRALRASDRNNDSE